MHAHPEVVPALPHAWTTNWVHQPPPSALPTTRMVFSQIKAQTGTSPTGTPLRKLQLFLGVPICLPAACFAGGWPVEERYGAESCSIRRCT